MFDVSGAGPAEKREKEESPWNSGHSYWFKLPLLEVVLAFTCALTVFWKVEIEAKTDETSNRAKIIIDKIFLEISLYLLILWHRDS